MAYVFQDADKLEMIEIGRRHGCEAEARQFIQENRGLDAFRSFVLESRYKATPLILDPNIGMSTAEVRRYSITKAILESGEGQLSGLEREASEAVEKLNHRRADGFYLPHDVMARSLQQVHGLNTGQLLSLAAGLMQMRSLSVTDSTKGGFLVGTDVLTSDMVELLRNKPLISQLGARVLSGLVGNVAIPRVTGAPAAYALSETGEVTLTDPAFGQLGLTPKRISGGMSFSKELLRQTSLDVEAFCREEILRTLVVKKDLLCLNGKGSEGEPIGIMNTTGVLTVTFGGAASWAKILNFEAQLATNNADRDGSIAWLTTPAVREKWKAITKISGSQYSDFLWEGRANGSGEVNGYRAEVTNQVPSNKVLYGNWNDFVIGDWAGVDVVVDPYTAKKSALIEVVVNLWFDCGLRHSVSMIVSTDTGAA